MEEDQQILLDQLLPLPKSIKILTTLAILFQNIAFGAVMNFFSPALEEQRIKYDSTIEEISKVFTIILVAYCIGGLSAGFIYQKLNRQFCVIVLYAGLAFALYITPHCPSLRTYFLTGAALGLCAGAYDTAQIVWMMEIWQSKAGPFIQAQNFCYALGSIVPPLLLAPFLNKTSNSSTPGNSTMEILQLTSEESRIYIPFTIGGVFCTIGSAMQIILFIFFRYYTPPLEEDLANDNSIRDISNETREESEESEEFIKQTKLTGNNWPKIRLVILSAMFLGAYSGMEMCTFQFIPTFGKYSDLNLSESDAAFVLSGMTGAFAMGRFLGIFIAIKIPQIFILCVNLMLILIGNLILLIWASNNLTMFWIACITIGAGFSTVYASFCTFMERYLVFTNAIGACLIVSGSSVGAIYPLIVGRSIQDKAVILTYTNFFSITICTIGLGVSYKLTYKRHRD